jgi:hypothetical protein
LCIFSLLGFSLTCCGKDKAEEKALATPLAAAQPAAPADAAAKGPVQENLQETIDCLLKFIGDSNCQFIRNGTEYDAKAGVDHVKSKYDHFKDEIKTPEDFIRLAATKSAMSGEDYKVKKPDGTVVRCADWLTEALAEYRKQKGT